MVFEPIWITLKLASSEHYFLAQEQMNQEKKESHLFEAFLV